MSRGPAKKPEVLRALQGYPDDKPPRKALKPRPSRPTIPANLDPDAKKEWKRVIDAAMRYGLCSDIDHAVFRTYIFEWQMCERLEKMCQEHGIHTTTPKGVIARAPWDTSLVQHRARLQSLMNEIGFTPAARTKVADAATAPPKEERDPFSVFDGGRK